MSKIGSGLDMLTPRLASELVLARLLPIAGLTNPRTGEENLLASLGVFMMTVFFLRYLAIKSKGAL